MSVLKHSRSQVLSSFFFLSSPSRTYSDSLWFNFNPEMENDLILGWITENCPCLFVEGVSPLWKNSMHNSKFRLFDRVCQDPEYTFLYLILLFNAFIPSPLHDNLYLNSAQLGYKVISKRLLGFSCCRKADAIWVMVCNTLCNNDFIRCKHKIYFLKKLRCFMKTY